MWRNYCWPLWTIGAVYQYYSSLVQALVIQVISADDAVVFYSGIGGWDHVVEGLFTTGIQLMEHFTPKSSGRYISVLSLSVCSLLLPLTALPNISHLCVYCSLLSLFFTCHCMSSERWNPGRLQLVLICCFSSTSL